MNENLRKYYEYLKTANADVPDSYESFALALSNEDNAKKYFAYLRNSGFDTPDNFESFSLGLGLKKKVSPLESAAMGETIGGQLSRIASEKQEDLLVDSSEAQQPLPFELQTPDLSLSTPESTFTPTTPTSLTGRYLRGEKIPRAEAERETTVVGDLLRTFTATSKRVLGGIAATPMFVNRSIASVTLRPIIKAMGGTDEEAEHVLNQITSTSTIGQSILITEQAQKYLNESAKRIEGKMTEIEGTIWENLTRGKDGERDVGRAFEMLGRGIVGAIPYSFLTAATAGAGTTAVLSTIGATAAAQQYAELEGVKEPTRVLNAWMYGGFEGIGEAMSAIIFRGIGRAFRQGITKTINENAAKGIAKGIASAMGLEGSAEAITQIGQNLTDIVTGVDTERNILDGVLDAAFIGAGFGLVLGGGGRIGASVLGKTLATDKEVDQVQNNFKEQKVLIDQMEITDSEPAKETLKKTLRNLRYEADKVMDKNAELAKELTPEQRTRVAELYSSWNELQNRIDDNLVTEQELPTIEAAIESVKNEIQEIRESVIAKLGEIKGEEAKYKIGEETFETKEEVEAWLDKNYVRRGLPPVWHQATEKVIDNWAKLNKEKIEKEEFERITKTEEEISDARREETEDISVTEKVIPEQDEGGEAFDGVRPDDQARVGEGEIDVNTLEKEMGDIETRLPNEKDPAKYDALQRRWTQIEKTLEDKERSDVFNTPLEDVNGVLDNLLKKEEEMPNGYGTFAEARDIRESKDVVEKYLNPESLSDTEIMNDFVSALRGRPITWYADGLKLRESAKEAAQRGITFDTLIKKATDIYTKEGYTDDVSLRVVKGFLDEIFKGAQKPRLELPAKPQIVTDKVTEAVPVQETQEITGHEQAEEVEQKSILNQETDLLGQEKEEAMIPAKAEGRRKVGDVVTFTDSQGNERQGNYRGVGQDGKAVIDVIETKDGKKYQNAFLIPMDNVKFPEFVSNEQIGAIEYAVENNLYNEWITEGRMTAQDAITIIESAKLEVPQDIIDLVTREQAPPKEEKPRKGIKEAKEPEIIPEGVQKPPRVTEKHPELAFLEQDLPSKKPAKGDLVDLTDFETGGEIAVKPIPQRIKTKTEDDALKNIVARDELRPVMNGIFYDVDNQAKVASDAHVLVVIPTKVTGRTRVINPKTNTEIKDVRYPNYQAVTPKNTNIIDDVNADELLSEISGVNRANDFVSQGWNQESAIKARILYGENEIYFNPSNIKRALSALMETGTTDIALEMPDNNTRAMVIRDKNNPKKYALVMPMMGEEGSTKFKTVLDKRTTEKEETIQPKPSWMLTLEQAKEQDTYPLKDELWERNVTAQHKKTIQDALRVTLKDQDTGRGTRKDMSEMEKAIIDGRMTVQDAIAVIESVKLEVPQDITDLVAKETVPQKPKSEQLKEKEVKKLAQEPVSKRPEPRSRKSEPQVPPKAEEVSERQPKAKTGQGIKYGDKFYTNIEQVQDDYDKFTDFKEYNRVLEQVRKYEDGLKSEAKERSSQVGKKLDLLADDAEAKLKNNIEEEGKLYFKILPPISRANTALWKQLSKVRDAMGNWIAQQLQSGVSSQTDALRWMSKVITNMYAGLGRTQEDMFANKTPNAIGKLEMMGTVKEYAPYEAAQIIDRLRNLVNFDPESLRRVRDALDPDIAQENITYDDLSQTEKNLFDAIKELNTWVHESNYADGFISTDTYLKFKDDDGNVTYIARMYDEYDIQLSTPEVEDFIKQNSMRFKLNTDIFKMRKEVDDWKKKHAITDPTYLTTKRVMQTIQNHAIKQYIDLLTQTSPNLIRDVPAGESVPKGFRQLSSSHGWGELRNKAVAQHIVEDLIGYYYSSHAINSVYDAFKVWDRSGLVQFYKKWHTVFNPLVQTGNFTGNLFFASIAGVSPIKLVAEMKEANDNAKKGTDEYKMVLRSGLLGRTGLTGDMTPITIQNKDIINGVTESQNALKSAVNILIKVDEKATELYQAADNLAKYAAYRIFRQQGLTHKQSVRRAYDSFQNYATVGKTWDMASKTPLIGPKFVKFQADLQRIILNAITMTPLATIGTLMLIKLIGNMASKLSGEDEDEKKIRETRKGVAKIPVVNIPLSFKVGKKEVNVARYLSPLYLYRYGDADADIAELSKFFPIQLQEYDKAQLGEKGIGPSFSDPFLGWIGSVVFDRDFRGISIQNPQASIYFNPSPTTEERIANVVNYVARAQLPFYKSLQDIMDGIYGRLDYYGRKRTWSDAILNNIIKIQEFDKPELKNYVENNVSYLTNRFASLSERMGNANSAFLREIRNAEEQELPQPVIDRIYREQDRIRANRIKALEKNIPEVMAEIERLTNVYKRWYPEDPFLEDNYMSIDAGRNRRFDVMDDIDLQRKYKDEYMLLKNNQLLRKPDVPKYINGRKVTDEQRKGYVQMYWSEYVRNIDGMIGLTQEEIDEKKAQIIRQEITTQLPKPKEVSALQELSAIAAQKARDVANGYIMNFK